MSLFLLPNNIFGHSCPHWWHHLLQWGFCMGFYRQTKMHACRDLGKQKLKDTYIDVRKSRETTN